jgi:hypothetical protein
MKCEKQLPPNRQLSNRPISEFLPEGFEENALGRKVDGR